MNGLPARETSNENKVTVEFRKLHLVGQICFDKGQGLIMTETCNGRGKTDAMLHCFQIRYKF